VAVTPPEAVRAQLHAYALSLGLPDTRVIPAENLHVTVLFLGNVAEAAIADLAAALVVVAASQPRFSLGIPHAAPGPPRRPTMLWGEVAGGEPVLRLSRAMHEAAAPFAPDRAQPQRTPHVTLARARSRLRGVERMALALDPPAFQVHELELIRSRLSPHRARYETVAALRLG
jgi:2'-5' RNA ligase